MIDIQQVKRDFENDVIISKITWANVLEIASTQPSIPSLTDAQCALAANLANVETDAWADELDVEPTSEQIDGFLVRALLRHLPKKLA